MNKLKIDWETCYGIKQLAHEFDFSGKNHTQLIYAPNGTMKSSFAMTFKDISLHKKEVQPLDRLRQIKSQKYEVNVDGQPIDPTSILVVNTEDDKIDASDKFSTFLASQDLKDKYNNILQVLNDKKGDMISKLSTVSQSKDCESEILEAFGIDQSTTIFKCLDEIYPHLSSNKNVYTFKYNNIFDKKGDIKNFLLKHKDKLQGYFNRYKELLFQSQLFRSEGTFIFGTKGVSDLKNMLKDGNFLGVHHKVVLNDGTEIESTDMLEKIIGEDKNRIFQDEDLKKKFDAITKAIDANTNLRLFKLEVERNPGLIVYLIDYESFRKKVWYSYMSSPDVLPFATALHKTYQAKKAKLQNILLEAGKQQVKWTKIINLYNDRFFVPFTVKIENQQDVILKADAARLSFIYHDNGDDIQEQRDDLMKILSRGEQRAFYILQILFEIEALKGNNKDNLIIFDDIADSFDYQNKYAIIEYLYDLHKEENTNFYLIVLTHNFDFYRTVASRCGLGHNQVWMAVKDKQGKVNLKAGQYRNDLFLYMMDHVSDDKYFLSLIPFIRNLIEYEKGVKDTDYLLLTSCLHIKNDTLKIKDDQVIPVFSRFSHGKTLNRVGNHQKIYDILIRTANAILTDANLDSVAIENKTVLSIACRLKAEMYLKKCILDNGGTSADLVCCKNQFKAWTDLYHKFIPGDGNEEIIEEVNMMTPEFIHVNSFMFEPLIDLSVDHLVDLYKKCKELPL
ncbi:MAG: hypothetical protein LKI18_03750 [Prevotella sp.]|jgi:hypothetical protein|nr:hypothetical protein [Prevotella sp.]